jgi:hypothetical protein
VPPKQVVLLLNLALCMQGVDTENDALLYQCKSLVADATPQQLAAAAEVRAAATANGTTGGVFENIDPAAFVYSSRPGAPFKLWLDFVGSVVTGTGAAHNQPNSNLPGSITLAYHCSTAAAPANFDV